MVADAIVLRQLVPTDGPAIDRLGRDTPDTGAVAFHSEFQHDAYETLMALRPETVGVVAEAPDKRIVGMGLVTFGNCQFEGELRPSAYLNSLGVHPDYRRRGIAPGSLPGESTRRREHFQATESEGVIFAVIQGGNVGSIRTATSWNNQVIEGRMSGAAIKIRQKPPRLWIGWRCVQRAMTSSLTWPTHRTASITTSTSTPRDGDEPQGMAVTDLPRGAIARGPRRDRGIGRDRGGTGRHRRGSADHESCRAHDSSLADRQCIPADPASGRDRSPLESRPLLVRPGPAKRSPATSGSRRAGCWASAGPSS